MFFSFVAKVFAAILAILYLVTRGNTIVQVLGPRPHYLLLQMGQWQRLVVLLIVTIEHLYMLKRSV